MSARYILNDDQEALYRAHPPAIAPSKIGERYWEGVWVNGRLFSDAQYRAMAQNGLDPQTVDRLDVIAPGTAGHLYITQPWALSFRQVVYFHRRIPCPVLGKRGDRLLVIAPNGHNKLVYPNGEISRPRARRAVGAGR